MLCRLCFAIIVLCLASPRAHAFVYRIYIRIVPPMLVYTLAHSWEKVSNVFSSSGFTFPSPLPSPIPSLSPLPSHSLSLSPLLRHPVHPRRIFAHRTIEINSCLLPTSHKALVHRECREKIANLPAVSCFTFHDHRICRESL